MIKLKNKIIMLVDLKVTDFLNKVAGSDPVPRGVGGERVFLFGSEEGLLSAFPEVASDFTFLQTCLGTRELPRYPDSGRSEYLGR